MPKMQQSQEHSKQDLLGRAYDEVFPNGIPKLDSPVQECPAPSPTLQTQTTPQVPMPIPGLQRAQHVIQAAQPVIQRAATKASNMLTSLLFSGLLHTL